LIDLNRKKRVHNYEDITSYVGDRFMAIRQDLTVLSSLEQEAIQILEA
jgi:hypothetical protein